MEFIALVYDLLRSYGTSQIAFGLPNFSPRRLFRNEG
jgi:hypothetical protein